MGQDRHNHSYRASSADGPLNTILYRQLHLPTLLLCGKDFLIWGTYKLCEEINKNTLSVSRITRLHITGFRKVIIRPLLNQRGKMLHVQELIARSEDGA